MHAETPYGTRCHDRGETAEVVAAMNPSELERVDVAYGLIVDERNERVLMVENEFFEDRGHYTLFVTFRGSISGGALVTGQDSEVRRVEWKTFAEAQRLMPWYGDIVSLLNRSARYLFAR